MSPLPVTVPHGRVEHIPRVHEFDIGQFEERADGADANRIMVLEREQTIQQSVLFGFVENFSEDGVDFTFSVEESSDNEISDAYSGINIRVNGADVANVVVKPKGQVEFLLESATEKFIRLTADSQDLSHGRVVITHFFGELIRRHRIVVP